MIGSGILWGEAMSEAYAYTLDPANGAAMLEVPFAHSIDGMLHALDSRIATVAGVLSNARRTTRLIGERGRAALDRSRSNPGDRHFEQWRTCHSALPRWLIACDKLPRGNQRHAG